MYYTYSSYLIIIMIILVNYYFTLVKNWHIRNLDILSKTTKFYLSTLPHPPLSSKKKKKDNLSLSHNKKPRDRQLLMLVQQLSKLELISLQISWLFLHGCNMAVAVSNITVCKGERKGQERVVPATSVPFCKKRKSFW